MSSTDPPTSPPVEQLDFCQGTLDSLTEPVAVLAADGTIVASNAAWKRYAERNAHAGASLGDDYIGCCEAIDEPPAQATAEALRAIIAGERDRFAVEFPYEDGGEPRWFELRASRHRSASAPHVVIQQIDVTERRRAADAAHRRAALLDAVDAAVIATDAAGIVTEWAGGAERLYGWTHEEAVGRRITELTVGPANPRTAEEIMRAVAATGRWEGQVDARRRDGSLFPAHVVDAELRDAEGRPAGIVGVSVDVSARMRYEREVRAARDYLRAVTDSMGEGVITVDMEGLLEYMNPAAERMLGWSMDALLGQSMHDAIHHRRADGSPLSHEECQLRRARRAAATRRVEDDYFIRRDGTGLPVEYTTAPFETAEGVAGHVVVFSDITERKAEQTRLEAQLEKLTWVGRIKDALKRERFTLHAQPIIDVVTGETVQHELLIRMKDEDGSLVAPCNFLPVAEEYGLIAEIDRWVVGQAAALAGAGHLVELNLSARSLGSPGFADVVERHLHAAGADPALMVFELTETAVLDAEQHHGMDFIRRIVALGASVALDDFGTGYGGFTYLKRLPVAFLKIDIEFVRDLPRNAASRHVVAAVVNLARGFGQKTVAEGVEDDETLDLLKALGVDYAQGYGIGRPAPVEEVMGLVPVPQPRAA